MSSLILPTDLGLPFPTWRPGQWECVETTLNTDKRFVCCAIPTGGGKSLYGVACSIMEAARSGYLTSTKGLQKQLIDDFGPSGLVNMMGRQNYQCSVSAGATCNEGRILECKDGNCSYTLNRARFMDALRWSSNYAYYFSSTMHGDGVGDLSLLILDEAHNAIQELSNAIEIKINHIDYELLYQSIGQDPPRGRPISEWRTWAKYGLPKAQEQFKLLKSQKKMKWIGVAERLVKTLERVSVAPESWILDETNWNETLISPLWPTDYAESHLFRGIPRIILSSATYVPKTSELLGVPQSESLFLTQDHTFPAHRCPVYLFGPVKVDFKMSAADWATTIATMDLFIKRRLDRKGLIHCVSYEYQRRILEISDYAHLMIAPKNTRELQEKLDEFESAPSPRIFISPAITTGYNFPYKAAEYNVMLKMPFVPTHSPLMKARAEKDSEYAPYLCAQTFTQICGRPMRAYDDQCETICLDAHAKWFFGRRHGYRHLFPNYLLNQLVWCDSQPSPLPALAA